MKIKKNPFNYPLNRNLYQRLIDALRKGRKRYPQQAHGNLYIGVDSACALGAIAAGLGLNLTHNSDYKEIEDRFVELGFTRTEAAHLITDIWSTNDRTAEDGDVRVIKFLEAKAAR